jgi:hypothetical protein
MEVECGEWFVILTYFVNYLSPKFIRIKFSEQKP